MDASLSKRKLEQLDYPPFCEIYPIWEPKQTKPHIHSCQCLTQIKFTLLCKELEEIISRNNGGITHNIKWCALISWELLARLVMNSIESSFNIFL